MINDNLSSFYFFQKKTSPFGNLCFRSLKSSFVLPFLVFSHLKGVGRPPLAGWGPGKQTTYLNVHQRTSYVIDTKIQKKSTLIRSHSTLFHYTMNAASMCLRTIHTDIFRMSTILRKSTQQFIRKHFDDQHGKTSKVRRWLVCSTVLHHAACCIQASCSPQFRKLHSSSRVSFPKHFTCSNQGINE